MDTNSCNPGSQVVGQSACKNACKHTHAHLYKSRAHRHTHTHTDTQAHVHVHVRMCANTHTSAHVHTHTSACTYTRARTCTHTHPPSRQATQPADRQLCPVKHTPQLVRSIDIAWFSIKPSWNRINERMKADWQIHRYAHAETTRRTKSLAKA